MSQSPEAPRLKYTIINPSLTQPKMLCSSDDESKSRGSPKPKSRSRYRPPFDFPRSPIPKESYPVALQKPQFVLPPTASDTPLIVVEGVTTDGDALTREFIELTAINAEDTIRCEKKTATDSVAESDASIWDCAEDSAGEEYAFPNHEEVFLGCSADGKPIHLAMCINELNHIVLMLTHDVSVEISSNRQVRMCIDGKASCTMDEEGRYAALHHPKIELVQEGLNMLLDVRDGPKIRADDESLIHIWTSQKKQKPMIHTINELMPNHSHAHRDFYVAADNFSLRTESDFTVGMFLERESTGLLSAQVNEANRRQALYSIRSSRFIQNGEFVMYLVGGVKVRHSLITGDTRVYVNHNLMSLKKHSLAATIQSPYIDFTIDRAWQFRAILGERCIQTSNDDHLEVLMANGFAHHFDMINVTAVDSVEL